MEDFSENLIKMCRMIEIIYSISRFLNRNLCETHVPSHRFGQENRSVLILIPVTVGLQQCLDTNLLATAFLAHLFLLLLLFLDLILLLWERPFRLHLCSNSLCQ